MTAPRPIGDYYASGQDAWTCEDCAQEWYACECEDEPPVCECCGDPLPDNAECEACSVILVPVERLSPTQVIV